MQFPEVNAFPEGYPNSALRSALALLLEIEASPAESGKEYRFQENSIPYRSRAAAFKSQK
jgi:hypothetical protein